MSKFLTILCLTTAITACGLDVSDTEESSYDVVIYQPWLESKYVTFYVDDVAQFRFFFDGVTATMIDPPSDPDQVLYAFSVLAQTIGEYEAEIRQYTVVPE